MKNSVVLKQEIVFDLDQILAKYGYTLEQVHYIGATSIVIKLVPGIDDVHNFKQIYWTDLTVEFGIFTNSETYLNGDKHSDLELEVSGQTTETVTLNGAVTKAELNEITKSLIGMGKAINE